ncbi:7252_t:CDS:2 [Racocetra persica]|uniref:7252_t:CDS:1 n=1 Tax=Racocetra persica TaxID=160502 RepID=A0ACA9KPN0_9GLOM|nr:7252_t:CDS:2 [Racocetra persica]
MEYISKFTEIRKEIFLESENDTYTQTPTPKINDQKRNEKNRYLIKDCDRPEDLNQCMLLCYDLEQYDPEAVRLLTKKKLEDSLEASSGSKTQTLKKEGLEFRKQEVLEIAVKRKAIAVHCAKVLKSHSDNRSDI